MTSVVRNASILRVVAIAPFLTACAVHSPFWSDSGEAGPPLASGGPTRQVQRCEVARLELFPGGGRTCELAFASQDGVRTSFVELHREVTQSLALASQMRPHLIEFRKEYQPSAIQWRRYPDYRLYVVALRPTIVVGVPVDSRLSAACFGPSGKECIRISDPKGWNGHSFSGWSGGLYYSKRPPVVAGAFAYIPSANAESVELPADQREVVLRTKDREFRLVNADGLWQVAN